MEFGFYWLVFSRFRRRRNPQCRERVEVSISAARSCTASPDRLDVLRSVAAVSTRVSDCAGRLPDTPPPPPDCGSRSPPPDAASGSTKLRSIGVTRPRRIAGPESRIVATTCSWRDHFTSAPPTLTMKSPTRTPAACQRHTHTHGRGGVTGVARRTPGDLGFLPHWAHFTVLRFIFVWCITVCCMHA